MSVESNEAPARTRRPRDAAASKQRLLTAAVELFAAQGYDRTTAREIGARAEVDPTMIARYFGGKAQLYIAALNADPHGAVKDPLDPDSLTWLLDCTRRHGPNPIYQVAARPHDDADCQSATRAELHRRVVEPLQQRFTRQGVDNPELRADVVAAAFIGVILARTSGAFDALPAATDTDLRTMLLDVLGP